MKVVEIEEVKYLRSPCQITNCVYNMYVCDLMVEENCCSDMDLEMELEKDLLLYLKLSSSSVAWNPFFKVMVEVNTYVEILRNTL